MPKPKPFIQKLLSTFLLLLIQIIFSNMTYAQNDALSKSPALAKKEVGIVESIERLDPQIDKIIKKGAQVEILGMGFTWTEGPLWVPELNALLFSDIPPNKIYKWSESNGVELYLTPSGYTDAKVRGGEVGSNGLTLDKQGKLCMCQHGDRRIARMEASLKEPKPVFSTIADKYEGKRFNSPNDLVFTRKGDGYFTDPPYGLEKNEEDPLKEIPFQGVYQISKEGKVQLVIKDLSRPNGIALSPDEKTLYVAVSDPQKAIWMAYDVKEDGTVSNGRIFYDATSWVGKEHGLPDGLKVNKDGIIFATGPGGVWIFDKNAKHLGTIRTGQATSNCALNDKEDTLYITADMYLMRVKLK